MRKTLITILLISTASLLAACGGGQTPETAAAPIKVKIVLVTMFERANIGLRPVQSYELDPTFFKEFGA